MKQPDPRNVWEGCRNARSCSSTCSPGKDTSCLGSRLARLSASVENAASARASISRRDGRGERSRLQLVSRYCNSSFSFLVGQFYWATLAVPVSLNTEKYLKHSSIHRELSIEVTVQTPWANATDLSSHYGGVREVYDQAPFYAPGPYEAWLVTGALGAHAKRSSFLSQPGSV